MSEKVLDAFENQSLFQRLRCIDANIAHNVLKFILWFWILQIVWQLIIEEKERRDVSVCPVQSPSWLQICCIPFVHSIGWNYTSSCDETNFLLSNRWLMKFTFPRGGGWIQITMVSVSAYASLVILNTFILYEVKNVFEWLSWLTLAGLKLEQFETGLACSTTHQLFIGLLFFL